MITILLKKSYLSEPVVKGGCLSVIVKTMVATVQPSPAIHNEINAICFLICCC